VPELPEVEFCARRLREWATGRRVVDAQAQPGKPLRDLTPEAFAAGLRGRRVERIDRRGKQLFVHLDADTTLLAHLGMTGKFVRVDRDAEPRAGERARLALDDGHTLSFVDPRRFGRLRLLPTADVPRHPEIACLGEDALDVCARPGALAGVLRGRRPIKVALMDQSVLAGVGNIYASEALFAAGIPPDAPAGSLAAAQVDALAHHLRACMVDSLEREKDSEIAYLHEGDAENPFRIYGRKGEPCPVCGEPIRRAEHAGRGTYYCPRCQA
jgi:formamidopyrimidine-DNA glycosylase